MAARIARQRPVSARKLAKALGVTPRSARRYQAEPRHDYETNSKAKLMPWALEGISRATWFRRRKRQRTGTEISGDKTKAGSPGKKE